MSVFDELSSLENPTVPDLSPGVADLLVGLSVDDLDIDYIAGELEKHPIIVARLIGLSNSAWSSPDRAIVNLKEACVRLGLGVVKSAAIAYAVAAPFDALRCPHFDPRRFWCCSLLTAEASEFLAEYHGEDAAIARTAGMLRNLGLIWLASAAPAATDEALCRIKLDATLCPKTVFIETIGATHLQASCRLFEVWGLPGELTELFSSEIDTESSLRYRLASHVATEAYVGTDRGSERGLPSTIPPEAIVDLGQHLQKLLPKTELVAQSIV